MVVVNDDARRVMIECEPHDVACRYKRTVERSDKHFSLIDQTIARVEQEYAEMLLRMERVPCGEPWTADFNTEVLSRTKWIEGPPCEFHRRLDAYGIGGANASGMCFYASHECGQSVLKEHASRPEIRLGANAASRDERNEFRVTEHSSSASSEPDGWVFFACQRCMVWLGCGREMKNCGGRRTGNSARVISGHELQVGTSHPPAPVPFRSCRM